MVASALAQEGVSRLSSCISTKLDDRASRAHIAARLEIALHRLGFALERTAKMPITYKHKQQVLEGHKEARQLVTSSSYLEQIIASAAEFSISSLAGLNKQCLSSSVVQIFEWYADCADKFVADVESGCPLRRDTFFCYPFVRQLLQGKYLSYERVKGSQKLCFDIWPVVLEGRGVETWLWYEHFNPHSLDKSFRLVLILRLSESTDIVVAAIDCLRSSTSLLNLTAQDAIMGELTQLPNLQDISDSYAPPSCYASALEYSLPSASDDEAAGRNVVMTDQSPVKLEVTFAPHWSSYNSYVIEAIGSKPDEHFPFGSIQQAVDMTRSRSVNCLIRQPEVTEYRMWWLSGHGAAGFKVEKPSTEAAAVPNNASGSSYNTRNAAKRKR
ncbi:hypothetical protein PVAP13_2KG282332 [Panicum virgatum]|uniref:Uncharacterized protein n=1 Tax=Panicum virgatum TaxID=38727 RepID=A0A8T0VU14_PANVG|nr:hypothetical protein PVAP13_2KG282332 [Panicum virgatum]